MRWTLMLLTALFGAALAAQQAPTNAEMAFIYELNRARANPQAYAAANSLGTLLDGVAAQPPLAVNNNLVQSARFHSDEMAANSYFAHTSMVTGDQPNAMARDAGYPLPGSWPDAGNNIESLAVLYSQGGSISYSAPAALRALIEDLGVNPPGHRIHLLAMNSFFEAHREIGAGYATGNAPTQSVPPPTSGSWNSGAYWSIHTARRNTTDPVWLTGVVYNDTNTNGRYDLGEGLGGVTVSTTGAGVLSTLTNSAGGWALAAGAGTYTVTCAGGAFSGTATADVTVAADNVEVDFASGATQGEVNFGGGTPPPGGGNPNPPPGNSDDTETTDNGGGGCSSAPAGTRLVWVIAPTLAALWRRRRLPASRAGC